ncbi:Uncharacterized protein FWK35_00019513, partial [Aphis craccivora]
MIILWKYFFEPKCKSTIILPFSTQVQFDHFLLGELASGGAIKKQIRRIRREVQEAPDAPKDLMTLLIPDEFKIYSPSEGIVEQFLLHDSGPGENRILIFGRYRNLEIL